MPVLLDMAISLNGHVGRDDGSDPGLYDWYFDPSEISKPVIDELVETTGAIVLGRNAFGQGDDTGGWDDTPYEVKHFVVTSRRLSDGRRRLITTVVTRAVVNSSSILRWSAARGERGDALGAVDGPPGGLVADA